MRQKHNQESEIYLSEGNLASRLILLLHLGGGYDPESKLTRSKIADSQVHFPKFLPVAFDGRFFGPFSSEIENAFDLGSDAGYIDEGNYTRSYEPVHLERSLTQDGEMYAKSLMKSPEDYGIDDLDKFIARQLSISSLPIDLVVSIGIHYANSGSVNVDVKECHAGQHKIPFVANGETISQMIKDMKEQDPKKSFVKDIALTKINEKEYSISYSLNKNNIRERYSYLKINKKNLEKQIEYFGKDYETSELKGVLFNSCSKDVDEQNKDSHHLKLTRLLKKHSGVLEHYIKETRDNLNLIDKNFSKIDKEYDHIFSVQKEIAELSENYPLETVISIGDKYTSSEIYIDEALKKGIRHMINENKVWHSGLDLYIQHIPQYLERTFLKQKNYNQASLEKSLIVR